MYEVSLVVEGYQSSGKADVTSMSIKVGPISLPTFQQLQSNAKLPDPFKLLNVTRISTKSQWEQRRAEISALAQKFEYGEKPPKPQSVTGSFSSNKITVTCTENGKTISYACSITYPSTGKAPYPVTTI